MQMESAKSDALTHRVKVTQIDEPIIEEQVIKP